MLAKSLVRACSAMGARGRFFSQHVANKYNSGDQERGMWSITRRVLEHQFPGSHVMCPYSPGFV